MISILKPEGNPVTLYISHTIIVNIYENHESNTILKF